MTLFWTALRQQRLALVVWAVVLALTVFTVVANARVVLTADIAALLAALPPALQNLMNTDLLIARPLDGYLHQKLFLIMPLLISIFAAFHAAGMVAREVERRQMDFVLSLPVGRARVLWIRMGALVTGCGLLWATILATLAAGLAQQGFCGDWTGYLLVAYNGLLLNAAIGTLTLWISAGATKYHRALGAGLGLSVLLYLLYIALTIAGSPVLWRRLVLYGFYVPHEILLSHRFPWPETLVLMLVAGAAATMAARTFTRREV